MLKGQRLHLHTHTQNKLWASPLRAARLWISDIFRFDPIGAVFLHVVASLRHCTPLVGLHGPQSVRSQIQHQPDGSGRRSPDCESASADKGLWRRGLARARLRHQERARRRQDSAAVVCVQNRGLQLSRVQLLQ